MITAKTAGQQGYFFKSVPGIGDTSIPVSPWTNIKQISLPPGVCYVDCLNDINLISTMYGTIFSVSNNTDDQAYNQTWANLAAIQYMCVTVVRIVTFNEYKGKVTASNKRDFAKVVSHSGRHEKTHGRFPNATQGCGAFEKDV